MRSSNTTRFASAELRHSLVDTFTQESKDVEDKVGDLIPWLTKLRGSVAAASADGNVEEAQRREKLIRLV